MTTEIVSFSRLSTCFKHPPRPRRWEWISVFEECVVSHGKIMRSEENMGKSGKWRSEGWKCDGVLIYFRYVLFFWVISSEVWFSRGSSEWVLGWFLSLGKTKSVRYGYILGHASYTLWLFNIVIENGSFIDDVPIKTTIYRVFSMAMLNNQMVVR